MADPQASSRIRACNRSTSSKLIARGPRVESHSGLHMYRRSRTAAATSTDSSATLNATALVSDITVCLASRFAYSSFDGTLTMCGTLQRRANPR